MTSISNLHLIFTRSANYVNQVIFGRGNLLLTNCIISTAMGALGDSIQQHYDMLVNGKEDEIKDDKSIVKVSKEKFDWTRNIHMSAAGFTTGLISHYWYIFLDRRLSTVKTFSIITKKVLLDQIIFSPVNWVVYFTTVGLCERSNVEKVTDEIIEKGLQDIYVAEWFIWPPAQYFNFYCLPLRYRILFDNIISLGFDIYSPYVKYKTELKKEKEAKLKEMLLNDKITCNLTLE